MLLKQQAIKCLLSKITYNTLKSLSNKQIKLFCGSSWKPNDLQWKSNIFFLILWPMSTFPIVVPITWLTLFLNISRFDWQKASGMSALNQFAGGRPRPRSLILFIINYISEFSLVSSSLIPRCRRWDPTLIPQWYQLIKIEFYLKYHGNSF